MADAPVWWEVAWAITETLAASPLMDQVQVCDSFPGEQAVTSDELVWIRELMSEDVSIPVMTAGTKHYDDTFEIVLVVDVRGRPDLRSTQIRLSEIHASIHRLLAESPTLADLAGVVSAVISGRRQTAVTTLDGPVGFGEVTISVHTRLMPD